jgi:hypothetical protein
VADPASSEWPVPLLLDEVWLRSRRMLVHALEEAEVWPSREEYQAFAERRQTTGRELRDRVLMPRLFDDDRRWLVSPSTFAASNRRFRSGVVRTLAFGHDLSCGLQMFDGRDADASAAGTCGLFNFGISVFDLLHDAQPALRTTFASSFDGSMLARLHSDPESPQMLLDAAADVAEPEVRLLLQIIAAVYADLHRMAGGNRNGALHRVTSLLGKAYAAEMQSTSADALGLDDRLKIARAKSTLPFAIIGAIGDLPGHASASDDCAGLTEDMATIFWLTDDLVDLVSDIRSGALNAIAASVAGNESLDRGKILRRLLECNAIDETAGRIRDALVRMRMRVRERASFDFDRTVVSYVRGWLE